MIGKILDNFVLRAKHGTECECAIFGPTSYGRPSSRHRQQGEHRVAKKDFLRSYVVRARLLGIGDGHAWMAEES